MMVRSALSPGKKARYAPRSGCERTARFGGSRSGQRGAGATKVNAAERRPSAAAREAGGEELAAAGGQVRRTKSSAAGGKGATHGK